VTASGLFSDFSAKVLNSAEEAHNKDVSTFMSNEHQQGFQLPS
jgi:hypothetical protein